MSKCPRRRKPLGGGWTMRQLIEGKTRVSSFVWIATLLVLCFAAFAQAAPITLYVAPNGNDAWTGMAADPNATATDGPLATIAGARDALRKMKADGKLNALANVQVREGAYYLS